MTRSEPLTRRSFCVGAGAFALLASGCTTTSTQGGGNLPPYRVLRSHYGMRKDGGHLVPAIPYRSISSKYLRQRVNLETRERPGTVIVDPYNRFLYLVEPEGKAMRYGVGVGREGFLWSGRAYVGWKRPWPTWTPTPSMIAREPQLAEYRGGLEPGINNPLGARALYLYRDGKDTLYRLHGTNEPRSIGRANSSGCIRLFNQDIIDLYDRVSANARVIVLSKGMSLRTA